VPHVEKSIEPIQALVYNYSIIPSSEVAKSELTASRNKRQYRAPIDLAGIRWTANFLASARDRDARMA
jgi:hypothetical protein